MQTHGRASLWSILNSVVDDAVVILLMLRHLTCYIGVGKQDAAVVLLELVFCQFSEEFKGNETGM